MEPTIEAIDDTVSSVGSTAAPDMSKARSMNLEPLVSTIMRPLRKEFASRDRSSNCLSIAESLLWPLLARRTHLIAGFRDSREFGRFRNSFRKTVLNLFKNSGIADKEQTFAKYWLNVLMCEVFEDDQRPEKPEWIVDSLFVGYLRRFVRLAVARGDVALIYSLAKGSKLAWPKLDEHSLLKALTKHKDRMCVFSSRAPISDRAKRVIQAVSHEVFTPMIANPSNLGTKFCPSGSACLQAGRAEGGTMAIFDAMSNPFIVKKDDGDGCQVLGKCRNLVRACDEWRSKNFDLCLSSAEKSFQAGTATDVVVIPIPEPSKYRIITKGDGFLNTALQPLQGLMLDCWKKTSYSTMLEKDDLTRRVQGLQDRSPDLPFFCSGDYEASTDLLARSVTFEILFALAKCDHPLWNFAWMSFLPGTATYRMPEPDQKDSKGRPLTKKVSVQMGEGQPMGHPLSFPLLCVANLAVYRLTVLKYREQFPHSRYHYDMTNVIVNGDDILFKCDSDFYKIFIETSKEFGFRISLGKNFLSRSACQINSQVFRISKTGLVKRVGYLNQRLMTGINVKTGISECTPTQIGRELNKMFKLVPWSCSTLPRTLSRWKGDWFGGWCPNWFIPVHLGGYGIDPAFGPEKIRVTKQQRLLAAIFVNHPELALYCMAGKKGPTGFQFFSKVVSTEMIPSDLNYVLNSYESEDISDQWLARACLGARLVSGKADAPIAMGDAISRFRSRVVRRDFRLHPLSREGMERYRSVRFISHSPGPCPPLQMLRYPFWFQRRYQTPWTGTRVGRPVSFGLGPARKWRVLVQKPSHQPEMVDPNTESMEVIAQTTED